MPQAVAVAAQVTVAAITAILEQGAMVGLPQSSTAPSVSTFPLVAVMGAVAAELAMLTTPRLRR